MNHFRIVQSLSRTITYPLRINTKAQTHLTTAESTTTNNQPNSQPSKPTLNQKHAHQRIKTQVRIRKTS